MRKNFKYKKSHIIKIRVISLFVFLALIWHFRKWFVKTSSYHQKWIWTWPLVGAMCLIHQGNNQGPAVLHIQQVFKFVDWKKNVLQKSSHLTVLYEYLGNCCLFLLQKKPLIKLSNSREKPTEVYISINYWSIWEKLTFSPFSLSIHPQDMVHNSMYLGVAFCL